MLLLVHGNYCHPCKVVIVFSFKVIGVPLNNKAMATRAERGSKILYSFDKIIIEVAQFICGSLFHCSKTMLRLPFQHLQKQIAETLKPSVTNRKHLFHQCCKLQFTTNEIAVLNAKSGDIFGLLSGFKGIEPEITKQKKTKTNHIHIKTFFKCCFQFISSVALIPLILKINFQLD
jgi:hypothetical protein